MVRDLNLQPGRRPGSQWHTFGLPVCWLPVCLAGLGLVLAAGLLLPGQPAGAQEADNGAAVPDEAAPPDAEPESEDAEMGDADPEHADPEHADDEHAGHDDSDLSHANPGSELESPAEWRFDLAIFSFVVFLLLLAVLLKFAWRPVMEGLDRRENAIATMIDEAKQNQVAAAKQLKEYEARLDRAAEEARAVVSKAHDDAQVTAEQIRKEARAEAERERQRALADIQSAKNAALDELTQKSVDLALGLAGNIVRKQLNSDDHAQLIREYLDQVPTNN